MKGKAFLLLALCLALLLAVLLRIEPFLTADSPAQAAANAPVKVADVQKDVQELRSIVANFLTAVKEPYRPPLGINEDFARALSGGNRYGDVFLPNGHPSLNDRGQIVDRWGTPYHFHPRAPDAIDVRSAGPDLTLFTQDDLVSAP